MVKIGGLLAVKVRESGDFGTLDTIYFELVFFRSS